MNIEEVKHGVKIPIIRNRYNRSGGDGLPPLMRKSKKKNKKSLYIGYKILYTITIDKREKEKLKMAIKDIKNITLEEAMEIYKNMKISFIIRDGELKGFGKN